MAGNHSIQLTLEGDDEAMVNNESRTVNASQLMEEPVAIAHTADKVIDVVWMLFQNRVGIVPMVDNNNTLLGIITWHQIIERVARGLPMNVPASEALQKENFLVFQLNERVDLDFTFDNYEIICVCDKDQFKGVINITTILKFCKWKSSMFSGFEDLSREYEEILNNCNGAIFVADNQGKITWFNDRAAQLCDSVNLFFGQSIEALERERIFFPSIVKVVMREKKAKTIIQGGLQDGRMIVTGTPIFDSSGEISRIVVFSQSFDGLFKNLQSFLDPKELDELNNQFIIADQKTEKLFSELCQLRKDNLYNKKLAHFVSREMRSVLQQAEKIAKVDSIVLLLGESGVGKDVLATTIHQQGSRKDGPFIKINCGAIPENLLESELFGYEPGAFTGAGNKRKLGLFEVANGGTLFLDEIAELPPLLQVKLLHVIQERAFLRVGGSRPISVDVRIIAATNKNLMEMVAAGTFREDLYYRLNVVPIIIPPLRKRKEDVPQLILHFLDTFNRKYQRNRQISAEVMKILLDYDWPGNIREVENLIERLVVIGDGDIIYPYELPQDIYKNRRLSDMLGGVQQMTLSEAVQAFEVEFIQETYKIYQNTAKVAEVLGVNRSTITRKLQKANTTRSKEI